MPNPLRSQTGPHSGTPSGTGPPPTSERGQILHLDLSGIESRRLRQEVRNAVSAQSLHSLRERDEVWAGPGAWIHSSPSTSDSPALLIANLSRIAEAVTPELSMRWLATCRSRILWAVAFVEGRPSSDDTVRIEGILRSLDGRLSLISEPRFTPLRRRWEGGEAQVRAVLDLLRPDSILEVRTLPDPLRFLLRFGDGRAATLSPEQLGVGGAAVELQLLSASPGPGGRSLRIGSRSGPQGKGLVLEAEVVQELLAREEVTVDLPTPEPTNVSMPIGRRIRVARRHEGLSQAELGERIGMAQAAISNLERGVHSPRMDTLKRIARGLGLSVPALMAFQVEE